MERSKKPLPINALAFVFAGVLVNVLNYVVSIAVSWRLSGVSYGELNALFSLLFILAIPTIILQTFVSNVMSERTASADPHGTGASYFVFSILAGIAAFLLIAPFAPFLSGYVHSPVSCILAVLLNLSLSFPISVGRGMLQGKKSFSLLWLSMVLEVFVKFLLVASFMYLADFSVGKVLFAVNAWSLVWLASILRSEWLVLDTERISGLLKKGDMLYFFQLFVWLAWILLMTNADLVLMRHFLPGESGMYGALSRLGQVILMGTNIVVSVFLPYYIGHYKKGKNTKPVFFASFLLVLLGWAVTAIAYSAFPSDIIVTLFGGGYGWWADLLPYFGLSYLFIALWSVMSNYLLSLRNYYANLSIGCGVACYFVLILVQHQSISDFVKAFFYSSVALFAVACVCLLAFRLKGKPRKNLDSVMIES